MLNVCFACVNVHKLWKPATGKGFEVWNFFTGYLEVY